MQINKNKETLQNFIKFCKAFPEQRFWQALCNWSGAAFIHFDGDDTFYWEGKNRFETELLPKTIITKKQNEQLKHTTKHDKTSRTNQKKQPRNTDRSDKRR
jgi:hypothetical protein